MDLNELYSRHQISLINAAAAPSEAARSAHLERASRYAGRIKAVRRAIIRGRL